MSVNSHDDNLASSNVNGSQVNLNPCSQRELEGNFYEELITWKPVTQETMQKLIHLQQESNFKQLFDIKARQLINDRIEFCQTHVNFLREKDSSRKILDALHSPPEISKIELQYACFNNDEKEAKILQFDICKVDASSKGTIKESRYGKIKHGYIASPIKNEQGLFTGLYQRTREVCIKISDINRASLGKNADNEEIFENVFDELKIICYSFAKTKSKGLESVLGAIPRKLF